MSITPVLFVIITSLQFAPNHIPNAIQKSDVLQGFRPRSKVSVDGSSLRCCHRVLRPVNVFEMPIPHRAVEARMCIDQGRAKDVARSEQPPGASCSMSGS